MTIITATAQKETEDSKLGVAFTRAGPDSPLMVKLIREESIFTPTELKAGMVVGSVQGEPMTWKTPKDAADILRAAPAGDVTITSDVFIGEITKSEDPDAKLGISLKNSTKMAGIFVSKIAEEGAFAGTELASGQQVILINDVPCPSTVREAIAMVKEAQGTLKIIAIPVGLTPPEDGAVPESAPVVEEKKEETVEESKPEEATKDIKMETVEPETMEEEDKGIIDKIFATCIC